MMPAIQLEIFEPEPDDGDRAQLLNAAELEDVKLAAFESGYKAGWDDACSAQNDAEAEDRAQVARAMQALAFTFHDARGHVLHALSPLIAEVAARLLPEIAHASLPHLVAEALTPYAELATDAPVILTASPASCPRIESLIGPNPGLPVKVVESPDLSPGQVSLRLGETETRVDIDAALATIRTALQDFFDLAAMENRHG